MVFAGGGGVLRLFVHFDFNGFCGGGGVLRLFVHFDFNVFFFFGGGVGGWV